MKPPQISHSEIEWYLKRARRERAQTIARFLRVGTRARLRRFTGPRPGLRNAPPSAGQPDEGS
jgi:hypothetical protein